PARRTRPYGRGRIAAAVRAADDRDMFSGAHVILYTRDAEADRAFLKDVAGFPHVDAGRGWLIFKLPPAEVAVHPTSEEPKHELYLMCDDLTATLKDLEDRGAEISRAITDQGWGLLAAVRLPSGTELPLYEPRHPTAHSLSP
ncbi:VOC family protein, partial [Streptomyces sp. NPDC127103]|uniref:VOC family protein n=3 Tax=Streptomyces TaxID=1883 RepID=UPI00365154D0